MGSQVLVSGIKKIKLYLKLFKKYFGVPTTEYHE